MEEIFEETEERQELGNYAYLEILVPTATK